MDNKTTFWRCEFENLHGKTQWKTIEAKNYVHALKEALKIYKATSLIPKYETLREAKDEEVSTICDMVKDNFKNSFKITIA